jgi:hypothetical protein
VIGLLRGSRVPLWVGACSVGSAFGLIVQLVKRVSVTMRKGVGGKGVIDMYSPNLKLNSRLE